MPDEAADALRDAPLTGARDETTWPSWSTGRTDRACPDGPRRGSLRGMWRATVDDDGARPAPGRYSAPENELPVALPVALVLARTDDVAVAITRLQVYSLGLSLDLVVRLRPSSVAATDGGLNELLWHGRRTGGGFLFGIGFADGRRASNVPGAGDDGVTLVSGGGSGGMAMVDQSWWLRPLPPQGSLTVAVRCEELGIEESLTELDGTAVLRAAEDVVTLWPWGTTAGGAARPGTPGPAIAGRQLGRRALSSRM